MIFRLKDDATASNASHKRPLQGWLQWTYRSARRWIVIGVGITVLLLGVALIVLPGPAIVVIPVGLAILAGELAWARRLLNKLKQGRDRMLSRNPRNSQKTAARSHE